MKCQKVYFPWIILEVPMMKILLVMLTVMNTYLNILTARTVMKPLGY